MHRCRRGRVYRARIGKQLQPLVALNPLQSAARLEHFSVIFPVSLRRSVYSGSLRGRIHRCAMETCSARIDPHTVFALATVANRLKHALSPSDARAEWGVV